MSDETQQRAVEYLLGEMEAPDAARFAALVARYDRAGPLPR